MGFFQVTANQEPVKEGVLERTFNHWFEFVELIRNEHANCPAYIYRGQAHSWPLKSTLDRLEGEYPTKRNFSGGIPKAFECPPAGRDDHLQAFKAAARGRTRVPIPDSQEDEWWELGQHHGLATPMLDWTLYPFAALFFAFEARRVEINGSFQEPDRRYVYRVAWHLVEEKLKTGEDGPSPIEPKLAITQRQFTQRAVFLKMPQECDLEEFIRKKFPDETGDQALSTRAVLEIISISGKEWQECLKFLNKMGLNRMSLFPDLDGAAKYINDLWQLDFDSSIGQIVSRRD
ncbi:MAG: FRG domain-containing protein [Planctomycetes bacterium]|nr:FRG domain-containing protein [Planctomycetota bacterium]